MNTESEASREAFERDNAWLKFGRDSAGVYINDETFNAWDDWQLAWQACESHMQDQVRTLQQQIVAREADLKFICDTFPRVIMLSKPLDALAHHDKQIEVAALRKAGDHFMYGSPWPVDSIRMYLYGVANAIELEGK